MLKTGDFELLLLVDGKVTEVVNVNIQILHSAEQVLGHPEDMHSQTWGQFTGMVLHGYKAQTKFSD